MTLDEQIAILQALKKGKKVEAKSRHVLNNPGWDLWTGSPNFADNDYRIVKEPRRFIIYSLHGCWYVKPYTNRIPDDAHIICTAVEELPPPPEVVDKFIEDVNAELAKRS